MIDPERSAQPPSPIERWVIETRQTLEQQLFDVDAEVAERKDASDTVGLLVANGAQEVIAARLGHLLELELLIGLDFSRPVTVMVGLQSHVEKLSAVLEGQTKVANRVGAHTAPLGMHAASVEETKTRAQLGDTVALMRCLADDLELDIPQ
ncbi:MAG: hypothetical protein U0520_01795 [Candidatus Saccharimonadales bacterium]